jgi:hypothetical protein
MKTQIADVVFRSREVDIPETCEHCGHDLMAENGLTICRYDYAYFSGNYKGEQHNPDEDFSDFEGEGPPLGFFCNNCGELVVFGKEKTIPVHNLEQVVEDTVWSKSVGRLLLGDLEGT